MFFSNKLLDAINLLSNDKFGKLFENLKKGISEAFEYFIKWMFQ
jgi:hypothetical protein